MKAKIVAAIGISLLFSILLTSTAHATRYSLTLGVQGNGTVTPDNTNNPYPSGVIVTLTASASNGWYFDHWSGNAGGAVNPLPVSMNSDLSITGNFLAYPPYSLTLATNGQGSIGLNPPGGNYLSNTTVNVTAMPAAGWVFAGWSGAFTSTNNPLSFAVDTNLSLTGTFAQLPAFDVEPASVTNQAGSTVSFSAHSVGTAPLSYQWYFSGGTLANATGNTLTLTNITTGQAGNYWAVATNNYGSATSSVAMLTVANAAGPTNVVKSPGEASLLAAIAQGGWVGMGFNGTVTLNNMVNITNHVILDGTGVAVAISGGGAVRLFQVASGASLTISNLTLVDGNTNFGAAIDCETGAVSLVGCVFADNQAVAGGSIYNNGGTVTMLSTTFSSNNAASGGGAVYQYSGSMVISDCSFLYNEVVGAGNGQAVSGGALASIAGDVTIKQSRFLGNIAIGFPGASGQSGAPAYGGALYSSANLVAVDSSFLGNEAKADARVELRSPGSGVAGGGAIYNAGSMALDRCCICSNFVRGGFTFPWELEAITGAPGYGGGIFNASQLTATNCTVAINAVIGGGAGEAGIPLSTCGAALGGGIFNNNSTTFAAMNLTVASNACFSPAGAYWVSGFAAGAQIANTNGAFSLHNSILAYSGTNSNAYGSVTDDGYNICSDNSAALDSGSSFNDTGPLLGPLANNGGPTLCMALLANSPAIDDADPSDFPGTDQRGYLRPFGGGPDIGAFEYGATVPAVSSLAMFSDAAGVGVSFNALPTYTYLLQSSTDLKTWTDVITIGPLSAETVINQMVAPPYYSHCYFRLIMQ